MINEESTFCQNNHITPYGDCNPARCKYGMHKKMINKHQALMNLYDYYEKSGFTVEVDLIHGRFIKATVKKGGLVLDKIIFDRRSGRIRSIY